MSYVKSTDFAAKDALASGNPSKIVKGTEIGAEFDAIETADALNVKTTALGTGVETALAVNVGSAGAPVVLNGVLGTPSSGTVTNLTGTASININGTVGATTPGTGAFTTITSTLGIQTTGAVLSGYGTGAGGAVTQGAGSGKATSVTLNKPCGQITMDNATLNAGVIAGFTFNNSLIAETDLVVFQISGGVVDVGAYNVWCRPQAGSAAMFVKNISAGNLSEAAVINFAVIKAVTS